MKKTSPEFKHVRRAINDYVDGPIMVNRICRVTEYEPCISYANGNGEYFTVETLRATRFRKYRLKKRK